MSFALIKASKVFISSFLQIGFSLCRGGLFPGVCVVNSSVSHCFSFSRAVPGLASSSPALLPFGAPASPPAPSVEPGSLWVQRAARALCGTNQVLVMISLSGFSNIQYFSDCCFFPLSFSEGKSNSDFPRFVCKWP